MTVFNDLNLSASKLIPDFLVGVNNEYLTKDGVAYLGIGLYLFIMISVFISAKRTSTFGAALTLAAIVGIIISGILVKIGLLTSLVFYLSIGLLLVGFSILFYERES